MNTEYFLWPSMLELKKILLEENRKKSVLEYAQRHFETALTNYRNQKETGESLLKIFNDEDSRRILEKILKNVLTLTKSNPCSLKTPFKKPNFLSWPERANWKKLIFFHLNQQVFTERSKPITLKNL